jgi:hypothetical protein
MVIFLSLFYAVLIVLICAAEWVIFEKAGRPGWYSLIPVYNTLVLLKIIGKPWWWLLLLMIPFVDLIWAIWMMNLLSKSYGKSVWFTIGLIFLSPIFYPILAFGDSKYVGPAGAPGFNPSSPPEISPRDYRLDSWLITVALFLIINGVFWFIIQQVGVYGRGLNILPSILFGCIPLITAGLLKNRSWRITLILLGTIYLAIQFQQFISAFTDYF